jgi:hypothetical protein
MPLSDTEYKEQILEELNQTGNTTLTDRVDKLWTMYEPDSYIHPDLRYLKTLEHACRWLMGQNWTKHQWVDGDSTRYDQQIMANLVLLHKEVKEVLADAKKNIPVSFTPIIGRLTTRTLNDYIGVVPDPNGARWRGDPVES